MLLPKSINKVLISLAILFVAAGTTYSQIKNENSLWFFIQITDPQFGMFENNESFEKETILYEQAVAGINNLKPDFVVITGDFVHNQNSEAQINEFKRITAKINAEIPVYYSPGNHDVGKTPDKGSLKKYQENYGEDRFVFSHKGSYCIGFNTSLIKGKLEKEEAQQYKWLEKQLKKAKDYSQLIVFCHYPFFIKNVEESTAYANIDLEDRKKYLNLFAAYGVNAVFTGHHHNSFLNSYGDVELVTTGPAGKPLGNGVSGMRIIKVYKDKIDHKYFGYEELPKSVKLKK